MATVLYKGKEKVLVEADRVQGMLKTGYTVEPVEEEVAEEVAEDKPKGKKG